MAPKNSDTRKSAEKAEKAESGNLRRIPIQENSHPPLNRAEFNTAGAKIAKAEKNVHVICVFFCVFVCFSVSVCHRARPLRCGDSLPPGGPDGMPRPI
jgi:hypothetical protein